MFTEVYLIYKMNPVVLVKSVFQQLRQMKLGYVIAVGLMHNYLSCLLQKTIWTLVLCLLNFV